MINERLQIGYLEVQNRPTVNGTGILLSGEAAGSIEKITLFDYLTGDPSITYVGKANDGSSINDSVWKIYKTEMNSNGTVLSNLSATNVTWTGRYLETYV